jgi:hypothetical protein
MGTEENIAASVNDEHDGLEAIKGIGPKFSKALYEIGIRRFVDLAQYTSQDLSKTLLEQAGVKVPPERIEVNNWIGQARALAQRPNTGRTLPEGEADAAKEPEEVPSPPTWRQHAGFSMFFDYVIDEHGEQVWQTRVYHDESGEERLVPGIETAQWVNWILERANLPIAAEPIPTEIEAAVLPTPVTPYDAQIVILDVQVSQVPTPPGVRGKKLMAEVRFQVSGVEAEKLAAERVPFQIEVHTLDVENEAAHLVASERSRLQPQVFEYTSQQEFPIPHLGRYELQSIVLLLPPGEMMAFHQGAPFRVVP